LLAGTAAAGGDVLARHADVSHVWPTAAGALLFFLVGYAARRAPRTAPFVAGALTHALFDGAWLVHALGTRAGLTVAAVAAAFDLSIDVLAASAGSRTGTRRVTPVAPK
jgi:hypothetical protein